MTKIVYISIGNEILIGKTVNTNEAFIGSQLADIGMPLEKTITIKDERETILNLLKSCWEKYDIIIVTGGLGPTHDDVTKSAICKFFKKELVFKNSVWNDIKKLYNEENQTIPEIVKTQAEIPEGFIALANKRGTAPGLYYSSNNKKIFVLPGVPAEMKHLFIENIIPMIKKQYHTTPLFQKTIRTIGIPESLLYTKTEEIKESEHTKIAFLPKPGMVDIRVYGFMEKEVNMFINHLQNKIPEENIYGFDDENIVSIFHKKMLDSRKTISAAESCTGGLIQNLITNNAGSSEYFLGGIVCYSNDAKMRLLKVQRSTIQKFGAVSRETVKEMVVGVQNLMESDYAIAVSGIAGPGGGLKEKPVGLVYIGVIGKSGLDITKNNFSGNRLAVKKKTAFTALHQLSKTL